MYILKILILTICIVLKSEAEMAKKGPDSEKFIEKCNSREMKCSDGTCIPVTWICDGDIDCRDGDDEPYNCTSSMCKTNEFQCSDGHCITDTAKCDGLVQCINGEDEVNCPTGCMNNQFQCTNGECIPSHWRCDFEYDCPHGSDEENCARNCTADEYKCSNYLCISKELVCDLHDDCPDGSDEKHCRQESGRTEPNKDAEPLNWSLSEDRRVISVGVGNNQHARLTITGNKSVQVFNFSDHEKLFQLFSKKIHIKNERESARTESNIETDSIYWRVSEERRVISVGVGNNQYARLTITRNKQDQIFKLSDQEKLFQQFSPILDIKKLTGAVKNKDMNGVNIYFLFDASRKFSEVLFEQMKELARIIISKIGISSSLGGVRVGAIKFSKTAEKVLHPLIDKTTDEALDKINAMKKTEKGSNILAALNALLHMIATVQASVERRNSKNYAFLISDGRISEGGKPNKEADRLHRRFSVETYAISVGANEDRDVLLTVTGNKQDRIFRFSDHKKVFELFSKIIDKKIDFSSCGLDQPKLMQEKLLNPAIQWQKGSTRRSRKKRVVGGEESKYAWPWMAAIYKLNSITNQFKFHCGGSIIHHYWILSAAHCFVIRNMNIIDIKRTEHNMRKESWKIILGRTDLTDIKTAATYYVREIIYHPDYAPENLANNVALIKTRGPIQYDIFTRPICLPPIFQGAIKQASLYEAGKTATVIGWGHTEAYEADNINPIDKKLTEILQELTIPLQPAEICQKTVKENICMQKFCRKIEIQPDAASLCAGNGLGGQDACMGDSGGPLMQFVKSNSNGLQERRWYQIGIVSWGIACGMKDKYGYYSHVARLRNWIVNTTDVEFEEVVPLEK